MLSMPGSLPKLSSITLPKSEMILGSDDEMPGIRI